ncbi:MAG: hypothetical protein ACFFDJ_04060 [Candidatus Odinarchaeota archaeon]
MKTKTLLVLVLGFTLLASFTGFRYTLTPNIVAAFATEAEAIKDPVPHHPVGTTVFGSLNYSLRERTHAIDFTEAGIYEVVFAFSCGHGLSEQLFYILGYGGTHYSPPFDTAFNDSVYYGWQVWSFSTGFSDNSSLPVTVTKPGSVYLTVASQNLDTLDYISYNFTASVEVLASSGTVLTLDIDNDITWTAENEWKWLQLSLPTTGLYNITATLTVPYDYMSSTTADPLSPFYIRDYEYAQPYSYFYFSVDIPGGGVGVAEQTIQRMIAVPDGDYFFAVQSQDFLYLNGGSVILTIHISELPTQVCSVGSPVTLNFDTVDFFEYVLLDMPQWYEHSVSFGNPQGAEWQVMGFDPYYMWPSGLAYAYSEVSGPFYQESRWTQAVNIPVNATPKDSITGKFNPNYWTVFKTQIDDSNGTIVGVNPIGMFSQSFIPMFPVAFQAMPMMGATPTFNVTLTIQDAPIPTISTGMTQTFNVNTTTGPVGHFFKVPLQSGHIYEIIADPTVYTTGGTYVLWAFPPDDFENWFFPRLMSPGYYGMAGLYIEYNTSRTLYFTSVTNGTLLAYVFALHMPPTYISDIEEIEVTVTETPPTAYTLNTAESFTLEHSLALRFPMQDNFYYILNINLNPPSAMILATIFDEEGNTPFAITEPELWITVSPFLYGSNFTSTYLSTKTGNVTLVITPSMAAGLGGTVTVEIIELRPFILGQLPGILQGLLIATAWGVPLGIGLAALISWLRRRRF